MQRRKQQLTIHDTSVKIINKIFRAVSSLEISLCKTSTEKYAVLNYAGQKDPSVRIPV